MELKTYFALDGNARVIPFVNFYVYYAGTEDLAAGLEDENGNPLGNPFSSGATGKVFVAAPNGNYDIKSVKGGVEYTERVQFNDVSDSVAAAEDAADRAESAAQLVGDEVAAATKIVRDLIPDGVTSEFDLGVDPGSKNNTDIFVNGYYTSKSDYEVSGTILQFNTAPDAGLDVEVVIGPSVQLLIGEAENIRFNSGGKVFSVQDLSDATEPEKGAGMVGISAGVDYKDKSVGFILQREMRLEDYYRGESSFNEAFERAKSNIQSRQSVGLSRGQAYNFDDSVVIDVPLSVVGGGRITTLHNGSLVDDLVRGVAVFTFSGILGDAVTVSPEASAALLKGVVIDCTGQINGDGLVMQGGAGWRSNREVSHVAVVGSSGHGVRIDAAKEDIFENVVTLDNSGNGWEILGSDLCFERCWSGRNGGNGLKWAAGSGAGRFTRFDSWSNGEDGLLLQGQNASFLSLQVDLNAGHGVHIARDGGLSAPKRFQFLGGNSIGGAPEKSDFYIESNANNITIMGWHFGYGHSSSPTGYAVNDVGTGVNNSLIGCTFEEDAYSGDVISDNVSSFWSVIGGNIDSKPLAPANESPKNLLVNGGFERWGGSSIPSGWISVSGSEGTATKDFSFGKSQVAVDLAATAASATQGIQQTIDIPAGLLKGRVLTVAGDFLASGGSTKTLQIREGASVQSLSIPSDGVARRLRQSRKITTDGNITVRIETKLLSDGAVTGSVKADNIILVVGGAADSVSDSESDAACGFSVLAGSATPTVRGFQNWKLQGATNVTNFSDGYEGKTIVVLGNGVVSIVHGGNIFTRSSASLLIPDGVAAQFRFIDGKWREI